MIVVKRKVRRGTSRTPQCSAAGCSHSARYEAIFLGTEHVLLCARCVKEWGAAYDNALRGWPDEEPHRLAVEYRESQAVA